MWIEKEKIPLRLSISDNHLAAYAVDTSRYVFAAPADGEAVMEVRLLFRRAFIKLVDQKGWDAPVILWSPSKSG